ncbi:MAG: hypothetical protein PHP50_14030 [Lachnospiraceae bacterium]|nr:hypothetical protein [Lachnospiraceae bacterium]
MKEERYWKQFMLSGKIEDYLKVKDMETENEGKPESWNRQGFRENDGRSAGNTEAR